MTAKLFTAPAELPVTLAQARQHLKVTVTAEDALILAAINAATEHAEDFTGRRFITQTWDLSLDAFPRSGPIMLPNAPLVSVTSVKYLDTAHVEQTLATSDYQVDTISQPGRIVVGVDTTWPQTSPKVNAVTVRFVCGYGLAGAVPFAIKAAILLLIQQQEQRDGDTKLEDAAHALLYPHRLVTFR
jgi:uncharacterized phiE125 gp8 family phage protein